ncbi:MAG TPA: GNAT family protein [Thermoleophilia bacterium]|nr:GNAT family protein [Thermoleophilia bacterium]
MKETISIGDFTVRDVRVEDAPSIAAYADNPRVAANLRDVFPHPYRLEDAQGFLAHVMQQLPPTVFAIATEAEAVGVIGLTLGEDVHRFTAELGYWLGEPFWGRGVMTSAVRVVVAHGFRELGLLRIHADPYAGNVGSARVLEKAGFELEGRMRANVFKNGRVLDQLLYSTIREGVA